MKIMLIQQHGMRMNGAHASDWLTSNAEWNFIRIRIDLLDFSNSRARLALDIFQSERRTQHISVCLCEARAINKIEKKNKNKINKNNTNIIISREIVSREHSVAYTGDSLSMNTHSDCVTCAPFVSKGKLPLSRRRAGRSSRSRAAAARVSFIQF